MTFPLPSPIEQDKRAPVRVVRPPRRARTYVFYILAIAAMLGAMMLFIDAGRWAGRVSEAMTIEEYAMSIIAAVTANMFLMGAMKG